MDASSRLKLFLNRLGSTYLTCDERGIRNFVFAPELPVNGRQFPSELLHGDTDTDDSDERESVEDELEGIGEREDSTGNAVGEVGADRRAVTESEEVRLENEVHIGWEGEAVEASLCAENSERTGEITQVQEEVNNERCSLSVQLEQCSLSASNPFETYGIFEGTPQLGVGTITFHVILSMLPPSERSSPLRVSVIKSARFSDLVGLTLFKYTTENPNSSVKLKNVNDYVVCIAGEQGGVSGRLSFVHPEKTIGEFPHSNVTLVEVSGKLILPNESDGKETFISVQDYERLSEA